MPLVAEGASLSLSWRLGPSILRIGRHSRLVTVNPHGKDQRRSKVAPAASPFGPSLATLACRAALAE
eukprot:6819804-Pyramimonas_sp.AAC.1